MFVCDVSESAHDYLSSGVRNDANDISNPIEAE